MVAGLFVDPGTTIHPSDAVVRVVGGGPGLRARFAVPEESAALLSGKHRARLVLEDRVLFATIDQVAPEVEPSSRTILVEGSVEPLAGTDSAMLAGRVIRASLVE